jgi:hypothetical protein
MRLPRISVLDTEIRAADIGRNGLLSPVDFERQKKA